MPPAITRSGRFALLLVLALAARPAAQAPGPPAPAPGPPRFVVAYVDVLPAGRDAMVAAFRAYHEAGRREAGYERIELFEEAGRRGRFVVVEAWRQPQDLEAHRMAPHVKPYRDRIDAIRVSGYDERPYRALNVAPAVAAPAEATHLIAHVDIGGPPGGAVALLQQLADESRKERGSLRFDVLQNTTRQNHFTVVETWASEAALDAHAAAPPTRRYRDALQPISGSPLDERVVRAIGD